MRAKLDALFGDLTQLGKAEHLKTAAIGQDRLVPVHEFVQPTHLLHQIRTGANIQVIGIAQNDLRTDLFDLRRRHPLDRGLCADRHEDRGLNRAMAGFEDTAAGRTGFFEQCEHAQNVIPATQDDKTGFHQVTDRGRSNIERNTEKKQP